MSNKDKEVDVNDAFESVFLAENLAEKKSYEEGLAIGKKQWFEAFHLGYHKGSQIASELGYFYGVAIFCQKNPTSEKVSDLCAKLLEEIDEFPKENVENRDIVGELEKIRFRFKRLCSLAKIDYPNLEGGKLEF